MMTLKKKKPLRRHYSLNLPMAPNFLKLDMNFSPLF